MISTGSGAFGDSAGRGGASGAEAAVHGPGRADAGGASGREPVIERVEPICRGGKYDYERLHVRTAAGRSLAREVVRHPGAVVVVARCDDGRVVLIRNYRVTVARWLLECCAGTIERPRLADGGFAAAEAGEDPAACAARELEEETGYRAGRLRPLGSFFTTPGLTDELMHAFFADGLVHVGQRLEPDELIDVELVTPARTLELIDRGEIADAKSQLAVLRAHRRGWLD